MATTNQAGLRADIFKVGLVHAAAWVQGWEIGEGREMEMLSSGWKANSPLQFFLSICEAHELMSIQTFRSEAAVERIDERIRF